MSTEDDNTETLLERARQDLLKFAGSTRTGTQLRAHFDVNYPALDIRAISGVTVGSGALAKFLREHFASVLRPVGKQGGDTVYLIGDGSSQVDARPSTNRWTAFVNPSLGLELVVNRVTGTLACQPIGTEVGPELVPVPAIAAADFRRIASAFTDTLPEELREALRPFSDAGDFTANWLTALRQRDPDSAHRWGLFRIKSLTELLRERLRNADLPTELVEECVRVLLTDQQAAYQAKVAARSSPRALQAGGTVMARGAEANPGAKASPDAADGHTLVLARKLASLVVARMSAEDIRELKVPLGAVIDAGFLVD